MKYMVIIACIISSNTAIANDLSTSDPLLDKLKKERALKGPLIQLKAGAPKDTTLKTWGLATSYCSYTDNKDPQDKYLYLEKVNPTTGVASTPDCAPKKIKWESLSKSSGIPETSRTLSLPVTPYMKKQGVGIKDINFPDNYIINYNKMYFSNSWRNSYCENNKVCSVAGGYLGNDPLTGVILSYKPSVRATPLVINAPESTGPLRIRNIDKTGKLLTLYTVSGSFAVTDAKGNAVLENGVPKTVNAPGGSTFVFDLITEQFLKPQPLPR